jgi:hypothetical protein
MHDEPILSYIQAQALLQARGAEVQSLVLSLDLGLSTADVTLDVAGVQLPDGQRLNWAQVGEIAEEKVVCFLVRENEPHKIQVFSERLHSSYNLMPTEGAPTILIGGFPMHRIKGTDPYHDTLAKLRALGKARGHVLDTTTGLGYTAIEAARTAERVTTIELDPATLEVARSNPWSRALFNTPSIEQIVGNASDVVQQFADARFSRIIHDPPIFSLAGELYSGEFYRHLFRVLKQGGRIFHYIGSLESKSGSGTARGVVRRLQQAGFSRVVRKPEAFGLLAYK